MRNDFMAIGRAGVRQAAVFAGALAIAGVVASAAWAGDAAAGRNSLSAAAQQPDQVRAVVDAFASNPLENNVLAGARGAGLDDGTPVASGETQVAVVLWDEFRRPAGAGGIASRIDATGSQIGSTVNGAAF